MSLSSSPLVGRVGWVEGADGSQFARAVRQLLGPTAPAKVLVVNRASAELGIRVLGSKVLEEGCLACRGAVTLSPSSQDVVRRPGVGVLCLECTVEAIRAVPA